MREHGVLRRALLVYAEPAPRLRANPGIVDPKALNDTAKLFRTFGEDYHERKLEEAHVFPAVRKAGGPCARVNNFKEVFDDPQIIARGVVQEVEHPRLGRMRTTRNPILFDHDGPAIERHSPMLGEHSADVLRELGYAPAGIRDLVASGVTRIASTPHKAGSVEAAE